MARILAVSGSPSPDSLTHKVTGLAAGLLRGERHQVDVLAVRDLPPAALLAADGRDRAVADAVRRMASADGVLVATPVYKASCSGLLKAFLDALPQFALDGKVVMPLATGGSLAHVLALDYGLRPVLTSMRPLLVTESVYVHSDSVREFPDGSCVLGPTARQALGGAVERFSSALGLLGRDAVAAVRG